MKKTILVVDDDKGILNTIRNILLSHGFNVVVAHNLELARESLDAADFLVLDINIGEENGLAFIKDLRDKGIDIPALIMTGLVSFQADELAMKYTRRPVFAKPLDIRAFLRAISESVNGTLPAAATNS